MQTEKQPTILYAVFLFSPDATVGIQNKLAQYAPCFHDCGIDIVVFNPVRDEVADNVRWIKYEQAGSRLLKLRLMLWKYRYLVDFLRKHPYDTVLLRYGFFDFSMPSLFRGHRIALEFHSKGLEEIWRYRLPLFVRAALYASERMFSGVFVRRAHALVAVTSELARYEAERCRSKAPQFTFSNGFDTGKVTTYRGDPPGDRFVIAFAAALFQPWHGLDRLLQSLLRMPPGSNVTLHLVGKVHNAEELELIRQLQAGSQCEVVLHGLIPAHEVGKVLAGAHLAVDSLGMFRLKMSESSTLKAKEYLAMGIPYIGSAVDVDAGDTTSFLAVPNDASMIDMDAVIRWRRNLPVPLSGGQLAATRDRLTWPHKVRALQQFLATVVPAPRRHSAGTHAEGPAQAYGAYPSAQYGSQPSAALALGRRVRSRLLICATVPETLATNLRGQPGYLNKFFDVELATSPDAVFRPRLGAEGVQVHEVAMRRGISPVADIASVFSMLRVLRAVRPSIVHSYTPKAGLVAMLAAWICRVPVRVHTFTGLIFPTATGLRRHLLVWIDRLICACATHVVPEGRGVKDDLETFRITRKPLQVIGSGNISGVDTTSFDPSLADTQRDAAELRRRLEIPLNAFVFCFVGRLHRDKGMTELLAAFCAMPDSVHLILVGGLDEHGALPGEQLHTISTHARIHMTGFVTDVRPALRASDVLVLPSYREGFPNSVLQAGAMGLPVIATDINGSNEIIEHGVNGWLVPAKDGNALRDAMERARLSPSAEREDMGQRARQRISERFEQMCHWERMVRFYRDLAGNVKGLM